LDNTTQDNGITLSREDATELRELIEDTVSYFCNSEGRMVSGETVYKVVECLAVAKQAQFAGLVD